MKHPIKRGLMTGSVILVVGLLSWAILRNNIHNLSENPHTSTGVRTQKQSMQDSITLVDTEKSPNRSVREGIDQAQHLTIQAAFEKLTGDLENLRIQLQKSDSKSMRQQALQAWFDSNLESRPSAQSIQAMVLWLASEDDFSTGIEFRPGKNLQLSGWNSARILLFDLLSKVDPEQSVKLAQEWAQQDTPSHEKILALRVLAATGLETDSGSFDWKTVLTDLYASAAEQQGTDYALLYGMDLFVYAGDSEPLAILIPLLDSDQNPQLAHASALALKRFSQQHPEAALQFVLQHSEMLDLHPDLTARILSHADPTQESQVEMIESMLDRSSGKSATMDRFFREYPNFNRSFSQNLVTSNQSPSMEDIKKADRAALSRVNQWLNENRFPSHTQQLKDLKSRLEKE